MMKNSRNSGNNNNNTTTDRPKSFTFDSLMLLCPSIKSENNNNNAAEATIPLFPFRSLHWYRFQRAIEISIGMQLISGSDVNLKILMNVTLSLDVRHCLSLTQSNVVYGPTYAWSGTKIICFSFSSSVAKLKFLG